MFVLWGMWFKCARGFSGIRAHHNQCVSAESSGAFTDVRGRRLFQGRRPICMHGTVVTQTALCKAKSCCRVQRPSDSGEPRVQQSQTTKRTRYDGFQSRGASLTSDGCSTSNAHNSELANDARSLGPGTRCSRCADALLGGSALVTMEFSKLSLVSIPAVIALDRASIGSENAWLHSEHSATFQTSTYLDALKPPASKETAYPALIRVRPEHITVSRFNIEQPRVTQPQIHKHLFRTDFWNVSSTTCAWTGTGARLADGGSYGFFFR